MSPRGHFLILPGHRADFRAKVIFSGYQDPLGRKDPARCRVLAEFLQTTASLFSEYPEDARCPHSAGEPALREARLIAPMLVRYRIGEG